jgi:ribosome biogenesis SPOUT family RNA methylase Rps3
MQKPPKIVVEHLEPKLSAWLLFEYENASKLLGKKILFTNVKSGHAREMLRRFGGVERRSVLDIFPHEKLVILDPRAKRTLAPRDFDGNTVAVVGGILGEHPPRGRTRALLTSKVPKAKTRNLGHEQFTIDGAVYIAKTIMGGKKISAIPIKSGLILRVKLKPRGVYEVELPYVYPIVKGSPLISKKLLKYLTGTKSPKIV